MSSSPLKTFCVAAVAGSLLATVPAFAQDKSPSKKPGREPVTNPVKAPGQANPDAPRQVSHPDKHPDPAHQHEVTRAGKEPWLDVDVQFSKRERVVLERYAYQGHHHHDSGHVHSRKGAKARPLPPGLAKKVARGGELPPGWQKKVAVGQVMPRDVYECAHPLPKEVVVKMPPPPKGTVVVVVQGKIVRLVEATLEILDVFEVGPRHNRS